MTAPKSPFRRPDPTQPLRGSNGPLGFLPSLREQYAKLKRDVDGLRLRMGTRLGAGEPAAAVGRRVFTPEAQAFALDYQQDGVSSVQAQYVLRSGQTYEIPVIFPPPGVFRARFINVYITQRVPDPQGTIHEYPVDTNDANLAAFLTSSTRKFSYPGSEPTASSGSYVPARLNYFWNLVDNKSGNRLSDQWLPDVLLLPSPALTRPYEAASNYAPSGGSFELDLPWLFERDADITFQFRPINDMVQPTVATTDVWAPPRAGNAGLAFDDREFNGTVRNNAVTVSVELHGTRHFTEQDAKRVGALSRDD